MNAALRAMLLLLTGLLVSACGEFDILEDDRDFDANPRTTDVTLENAELIALGVTHATIYPTVYLPLSEFLDASDRPAAATLTALPASGQYLNTDFYTHACIGGGFAYYQSTQESGLRHRVGDEVLLEYDACIDADGNERNGRFRARYTALEGINDRFVLIDTPRCIAELIDSISGTVERIDVSVDDVNISRFGDQVKVTFLNLVTDLPSGLLPYFEVVDERFFGNDDKVLILNARTSGLPTSEGGDDIYTVLDGEGKRERCQAYRRNLTATLTDYSVRVGGVEVVQNGRVSLEEYTDDQVVSSIQIENSDIGVRVHEGMSSVGYTHAIDDYLLSRNTSGAYVVSNRALLSSSAVFGTVDILNSDELSGERFGELPVTGRLPVNARDQEHVYLVPDETALTIQVDFNGDANGDTFPDIDEQIFTSWARLIARDFIEVTP